MAACAARLRLRPGRGRRLASTAALSWLEGRPAPAPGVVPASALVRALPTLSSSVVLLDCGAPHAFLRARVPHSVRLAASEGFKDPRHASRLLDARDVEALAAAHGIGANSRVLAYDGGAYYQAAHVAWALRHFGLVHAAALDGGWPCYVEAGGPIAVRGGSAATPAEVPVDGAFFATEGTSSPLLATADEVLDAVAAVGLRRGATQILDARSVGEFSGADLRGNVRGGHVPGAINVPHTSMLAPDGALRDRAGLREVFERAGVDLARPILAYCQLGLRGSLAVLALERAGATARVANYDSSMREWLNDPRFPVEGSPS